MTEFRVEKKYLVSDLDLAVLSQRLSRVMERDEHQDGDCYVIRSLYFDDFEDTYYRTLQAWTGEANTGFGSMIPRDR